jgi:hypothetical protein
MFALGNVYRLMGRKQEAIKLLTELYEVVIRTQTIKSDTAVSLAKSLCDMHNEVSSSAALFAAVD